jgi:hypothetical protein
VTNTPEKRKFVTMLPQSRGITSNSKAFLLRG